MITKTPKRLFHVVKEEPYYTPSGIEEAEIGFVLSLMDPEGDESPLSVSVGISTGMAPRSKISIERQGETIPLEKIHECLRDDLQWRIDALIDQCHLTSERLKITVSGFSPFQLPYAGWSIVDFNSAGMVHWRYPLGDIFYLHLLLAPPGREESQLSVQSRIAYAYITPDKEGDGEKALTLLSKSIGYVHNSEEVRKMLRSLFLDMITRVKTTLGQMEGFLCLLGGTNHE